LNSPVRIDPRMDLTTQPRRVPCIDRRAATAAVFAFEFAFEFASDTARSFFIGIRSVRNLVTPGTRLAAERGST